MPRGRKPKGKKHERLKEYGTSDTPCSFHPRQKRPCLVCACKKYNRIHGVELPDVPPTLYDEKHRKAVLDQQAYVTELVEHIVGPSDMYRGEFQ
jgi:hypothetical protein